MKTLRCTKGICVWCVSLKVDWLSFLWIARYWCPYQTSTLGNPLFMGSFLQVALNPTFMAGHVKSRTILPVQVFSMWVGCPATTLAWCYLMLVVVMVWTLNLFILTLFCRLDEVGGVEVDGRFFSCFQTEVH